MDPWGWLSFDIDNIGRGGNNKLNRAIESYKKKLFESLVLKT